jgi:cell division protein FtsW
MNQSATWLGRLKGDRGIWLVVLFLAIASMLAVYSATGSMAYLYSGGKSPDMYLLKHGFLIALSIGLTYATSQVHYKLFHRMAPMLLVITIGLLLYTFFFGSNVNEARRWIELPVVGITFQTSDLAKLVLILYVARLIASKQDTMKTRQVLMPIILPVMLVCVLIAPSDLSTAGILFATCFTMMVIGRVHMKYLAAMFLMGAAGAFLLYTVGTAFPEWVRVETWVSRVQDFMSDSEGEYQVKQAKIAIAEGNLFGVGPGNSEQRNYLPYAYADFIYAIICEEWGLLGGTAIIGCYLYFFYRCVKVMTRSLKVFGGILAVGLGLSLVIQAFANIAVSVHLVPVTGLTLPFVSMGGTSLLFTSVAFGMILSVSRTVEAARKAAEEKEAEYVASPDY